jgi:hypothetical protein
MFVTVLVVTVQAHSEVVAGEDILCICPVRLKDQPEYVRRPNRKMLVEILQTRMSCKVFSRSRKGCHPLFIDRNRSEVKMDAWACCKATARVPQAV